MRHAVWPKAEGGAMKNGEDVYAAGRWVAIAADEYATAVTEAVTLRRCEVVRLVDAMRSAETLADAARIETELTSRSGTVRSRVDAETIACRQP